MMLVLFGPGGVGKGTLVERLLERDPRLWLSRSWTTRARRPGEAVDAYRFVDRATFLANAEAGGFLEWVEVLPDQLSGTPWPEVPEGRDLLLEIDLNGARQVRQRYQEAVLVLVLPPSREAQEARMRRRGDTEEQISRRLALGEVEGREGRLVADHVVVNDDLGRAVDELAGILAAHR